MSSPHLTVGGLIKFDYKLTCVSRTIKIVSVAAMLHTITRVKSLDDPSMKEVITTKNLFIFNLNANRIGMEESFLEAFDAESRLVSPIPSSPGNNPLASRFMTFPSSKPFQIVPKGGKLHVSAYTLSSSIHPLSFVGIQAVYYTLRNMTDWPIFLGLPSSATACTLHNSSINIARDKDTYRGQSQTRPHHICSAHSQSRR